MSYGGSEVYLQVVSDRIAWQTTGYGRCARYPQVIDQVQVLLACQVSTYVGQWQDLQSEFQRFTRIVDMDSEGMSFWSTDAQVYKLVR